MRVAGAIDIGGTSTKIGIVAADGSIVMRDRVPTSLGGDPSGVVHAIRLAFGAMMEKATGPGYAIEGVGVSVAGFLTPDHSAMVHNPNLPMLRDFPLRRALTESLDMECRLEVDSNASTVAEYQHGAGRGAQRLLGIVIGTGVGGGVIIDRQLLRFTGECSGDIGHVIVDPNGRLCTCGARGCLEAMVNTTALMDLAGGAPVRETVTAAREGDPAARKILAQAGEWVGLGLASLSPIFSPDRIVVGGGIAAAGDALLDPTRESYRKHARPEFAEHTEVIGSPFDGWEGLVGAASLFLDPVP
ncbi:MAG TPA: ROK family protein [Gemmatimonadaceae bacterium]|jgi:glucokinase|nr:ROK family protein [Gemmatimonadaceae bacterium]